jgi:glycosyltransferase involved in cell wall biosynthesis
MIPTSGAEGEFEPKPSLDDAMLSPEIRRPVHTVLLLQDLEYGGTQRYAMHLLKHLNRELFEPELWVLRGGMDMLRWAKDAGVKVTWMSLSPVIVWPHALARLAYWIGKVRPQILYTLTVVPNIWGRLFAAIARIPVIVTSYRDLNPNQYERLMWRLSTRIICNCHALKEECKARKKVNPEKVAVVPNAVDAELFKPDPSQKTPYPSVLFAGRLARVKDPVNLIEAFRTVVGKIPEAQLEIMGNGGLRGKIEKLIAEYSLQDNVRLISGQHDVRPALRRCWVFAMPSRREASPNAILEAMAAELPVVGSRVGGVPEVVEDGATGIIVEPREPAALADAIVVLLQDASLRRSMGKKGRERVMADHTMNSMIRGTERVLIQALNETLGGKA